MDSLLPSQPDPLHLFIYAFSRLHEMYMNDSFLSKPNNSIIIVPFREKFATN